MTSAPRPRTSSAATFDGGEPEDDGIIFEEMTVWPDEIKPGDIFAGYVVTAIARSDHYREPAVRLTIYTDPDALDPDQRSEEWGRIVLRTDRTHGHQVTVERPRP